MSRVDTIIKGNIFDSIGNETFEGFVAICGNKIVAVEKGFADIEKWMDSGTNCIDCHGKLIMPGFIDAHMHFFDGAFQNSKFMCRDLFQCKSARECVDVVAQFAKKNPDYKTLTAMGWFIPLWTDDEKPNRYMLDEVESERPVYLMCADGHSFWLNSKALEACNIKADQELLFGSIELDEYGEPNGVLHELDVCAPCAVKSQKLPSEDAKKIIVDFISELSKYGITTTTDMSVLPKPTQMTEEMEIVKELEEEEKLNIRLNLYPSLGVTEDFSIADGLRNKFNTSMYRVPGLKAFVDGVHGNNTALLLKPYIDQPDQMGSSFYPYDVYERQVVAANREGFSVKLHCVGEGATHLALDVYERSFKLNGNENIRNSIEHVETLIVEDIERLADLNVTATMQPSHLMYEGNTLREKVGEERAKLEYALKTMLNAGVNIAFSTDYPVAPFDPMRNIYFSTTRCDAEGNMVGKEPEQRLTLAEALKAYTFGSAYCLNIEKELGTLEEGKRADIVVFDRDLFKSEPKELLEATIELTMSDGKIIYKKQLS